MHDLYQGSRSVPSCGDAFSILYAATVTISFVNICTPTTEMNTNVKTEPMGDMALIVLKFKVQLVTLSIDSKQLGTKITVCDHEIDCVETYHMDIGG